MKKLNNPKIKNLLTVIFVLIPLAFSFLSCGNTTTPANKDPEKEEVDEGPRAVSHPDAEMESLDVSAMNAIQLVDAMKTGWNLGNTLDATGNSGLNTETSWGQPKTTKAMIDGIKKAGFRTIRIPVSWNEHVSNDGNFTVDAAWMARVKEVVDWAYNQKMFVIINAHHDCYDKNSAIPANKGFYYPSTQNKTVSADYLTKLWKQIATTFASYDNHIVFETMNEPRLRGTGNEWWYDSNSELCRDARDALNDLNQTALDAIRSVSGNENRLVMVPGLQAAPDSAFAEGFKIPNDSANMVALSVHMYTPYDFAMKSPGDTEFLHKHKNEIVKKSAVPTYPKFYKFYAA